MLFHADSLTGQKPLTMYFLRRAHDLYKNRPQKSLSPSFWESEGTSPFDVQSIDAIMLGIEHPLGAYFSPSSSTEINDLTIRSPIVHYW